MNKWKKPLIQFALVVVIVVLRNRCCKNDVFISQGAGEENTECVRSVAECDTGLSRNAANDSAGVWDRQAANGSSGRPAGIG